MFLVPVFAELLIDLIDWHVCDGLLRNVVIVLGRTEVGLLEINCSGVVQSDCESALRRSFLFNIIEVAQCITLGLYTRKQAIFVCFTLRCLSLGHVLVLTQASGSMLSVSSCLILPLGCLLAPKAYVLTLSILSVSLALPQLLSKSFAALCVVFLRLDSASSLFDPSLG